ncbi:MAG: hypothetical protein LWW93_16840 [Hyphomicrobiales bacterium]|nr:hypothetical protein [Hyphomicrobiales bacterium]
MTNRDVVLSHVLEWSFGGRPFSLRTVGALAVLTTPDGQILELARDEWAALAKAIAESGLAGARCEPKRKPPANTGRPWTEELDRLLVTSWRTGASVSALARDFERTEGAIASRLVRLGEIRYAPSHGGDAAAPLTAHAPDLAVRSLGTSGRG